MLVTRQLTAPIDFHEIFFPSVEVNGCRQLSDYQHSSKYNLAVFKRKKKDTRTGLEQLEGE